MKIFISYNDKAIKEGFVTKDLLCFISDKLPTEGVEEIYGEGVLEKTSSLTALIQECHRVLKPGAKAVFNSPHFANGLAWAHPGNIRGISEHSLAFASREWRDKNPGIDIAGSVDFEVTANVAIEPAIGTRADDVRLFWMQRYLNTVQAIIFTLTKK